MTTLVLLRGLMRDSRHWYGFDQDLAQRDINVISVDLPGNGTLVNQTSPTCMQDYSNAVWQQIDDALLKQGKVPCQIKVVLVGLSMGGMLALTMAAQRPARIEHVVLINSSATNLSPWYYRFQLWGLLASLYTVSTRVLRVYLSNCDASNKHDWLEAIVLAFTSKHFGQNIEVITAWSLLRLQCHTSLVNGLRQLYACARFHSPAIHTVPVSVIVANQDKLAHPKCSEKLALFYQTQLYKIDDCGHDVSLDKPEQLQRLLINIISNTKHGINDEY
ncbi:alpha/beta fold hydrolase [Shewanella ulleungensis]|uniref:Alpha/beta hydrolase n=1 Tax=Shewanella ulleungensis TaxID=2282699 RepID=A0ABQ2QHS3_9GAMM|nr:alpha/beta hydrolase [Shewanella ulleungensis]MCL1149474.1 alpha/beta hydrolase [Shewanella ulleungensis]GGP79308.1 alpha/beta hydrolase [Shewanella ulleungensis]